MAPSVKLPDFKPEMLDLPELEEPQTGEQLQKRYDISKSQFHNRKNAMSFIQGFSHGRKKMFTLEECYQLDAAHWYLKQGFTLEDLTEAYKNFELEIEDDSVLEVENLEQEIKQSNLATIDPSMRQFSNEMAKHIVEAVHKVAPKPLRDPLRPFRLLKEASEDRYEITSKMLANILELKLSTIHSFKSTEVRHGFLIAKNGKGKWVVTRLEEEAAA